MASGTSNWLIDVWGTSPTNVYAVGCFGLVLHYDGVQWTEMANQPLNYCFRSIWGTSPSNIYAVEHTRALHHFDGTTWAQVDGPTGGLLDVWGIAADDVFASNSWGQIFHYDGVAWTEMTNALSYPVFALWGSSACDVFGVGRGGGVVHYGPPYPTGVNDTTPGTRLYFTNHPNPFNPTTDIRFEIAHARHVTLSIYTIEGKHVTTLVDGFMGVGPHGVVWDGRDARGGELASGVYFSVLQVGKQTAVRKLVLVR